MSEKGFLNRELSSEERSRAKKILQKGRIVYRFYGATYGCISDEGIAVTDGPDNNYFYEVPINAVTWTPPETLVKNCQSIEEIKILIEKLGGVLGSDVFFTPEEFNKLIENLRKSANHITRAGGLRKKIVELLIKEI